ncbi:NAD(P)-binding protein [Lophiostoma macrostomum CBS 122681]|uniref:NAD(P)-binding protein n=1 Tax=Lophiostoma macrostomum CBS 122681 TaxID=1314788 RepID=A0A6A6TJ60_9PLEO|nr:NAD(P)-binding protein [Lophiostoma macrostomum CBS 122681]
MAQRNEILLLGAGELGAAFLPHLATLAQTHVTIGVRTPSKYEHLSKDRDNVGLLTLDTTGPSEELSRIFAKFDTVISCTGFGQSPEGMSKLAEEVLRAGRIRAEEGKGRVWFFPWQWGVDYDVTGDSEGLMPLFGEQVKVRNLLRKTAVQSNIKWTIVSTGIFMSFLFEQFWGMVDQEDRRIKVRALGSWDHKVSVTDVGDIGKCLAKVVAGDIESENRIVYVG